VVQARFYFDLASPECYLAAERVLRALPGAVAWQPVLARELAAREPVREPLGERHGVSLDTAAIERRARELSLQPIRWPESFPFDSELAMLVATYAKSIGRVTAFALAAFRQAFAGGHDLEQTDNVLVAASACEMHPRAVLAAARRPRTRRELRGFGEAARQAGVTRLPAVTIGGRAFAGTDALERAAAFAAAAATAGA
jgi:2-hydroxychromene-2-carboxylate isomerase